MVFCEAGSTVFQGYSKSTHATGTARPLKRDGGIDHLDAIHGGLVDQHDHPGRGLLSQDHRQHALGQTGSVKVLTFQEAREPFIAAFKLLALGEDAGDGSEVQSAVAETDAPGQVEESASQTGKVLAHRAAEVGEVRIDDLPDGGKKVLFLIHLYK